MRKGGGGFGGIKVWKGTEMVDRSGVRIMLRLPRKARFRIIMVAHGGDCEVFAASHVAHSRVRAGIASILPTIIITHRSTCVQTLLLLARMLACDHCNAGKAGLCRAQFQRQLHVGHRPSSSLGCGEGIAQASKSLQRRCAISELSRAGGCLASAWAIHSFCIAHASCEKRGKKATKDRGR